MEKIEGEFRLWRKSPRPMTAKDLKVFLPHIITLVILLPFAVLSLWTVWHTEIVDTRKNVVIDRPIVEELLIEIRKLNAGTGENGWEWYD